MPVCAYEEYKRGAYFIETRRRLSSLRGPVTQSQLGVDRSLLFFSALLRAGSRAFSKNEYVRSSPSKWSRGDSPRLHACKNRLNMQDLT